MASYGILIKKNNLIAEEGDMILNKRCILFWISLLAGIIALAACKGTTVRVGGEERYELKRSMTAPNYWEATVQGDIESVHTAVLAGIEELGLNVKGDNYDKLSGLTTGVFADNASFTVKLSSKVEGTVLVRIKAGLTGNKDRSVQLFQAIAGHF